jgi:hypothetical protein
LAAQALKTQLESAPDEELMAAGIEEILADHNGDAKRAIRALLDQISYLEMTRNKAIALASVGFARGKLQ